MKRTLLFLSFLVVGCMGVSAQDLPECEFTQDSLQKLVNKDFPAGIDYSRYHYNQKESYSDACKFFAIINFYTTKVFSGDKDTADILWTELSESPLNLEYPRFYNKAKMIKSSYLINTSRNGEAREILEDVLKQDGLRRKDSLRVLNNLAIALNNLKDFGGSVEYLQKGLAVFEKDTTLDEGLKYEFYSQLGVSNMNLYNYEEGITATKKAIDVRRKQGVFYYHLNDFSKLALAYVKLEDTENAMIALDSAFAYKDYNPSYLGPYYMQLGDVHGLNKDFKKAEEAYAEAVKVVEQTGLSAYVFNANKNILHYKAKQGKTKGYGPYIKKLYSCCEGSLDRQDSLVIEGLEVVDRLSAKNSNESLAIMDLLLKKDMFYEDKVRDNINEVKIKYETDKKTQENILLLQKKNEDAAQLKKQRNQLIGGGIGLGLITLLAGLLWRSIVRERKYSLEIKKQKDQVTLLNRELSHRVKNNLAFMTSLLEMQGRRSSNPEVKEIISNSELRLKALSLVHTNLFNNDKDTVIDLKEYLSEMIDHLQSVFELPEKGLSVEKSLSDMQIDAEDAMRIGLIVNELFTNSVKHAFDDVDNPTVKISTSKNSAGKVVLDYADNGPGFDQEELTSRAKGTSIGMKLISLLEKQLSQRLVLNWS